MLRDVAWLARFMGNADLNRPSTRSPTRTKNRIESPWAAPLFTQARHGLHMTRNTIVVLVTIAAAALLALAVYKLLSMLGY